MGAEQEVLAEAKAAGFKAILTLGLVYTIKQFLDTENERHVQICQLGYAAAFVLQVLVTLYIKAKVAKLEGTEAMVTVIKKDNLFDSEEKKIRQNIYDYDTEQVNQKIQQLLISGAMIAFLYLKMELVLPLAIQTFLGPYSTYEAPMFKVHVLGQAAQGKLKRPWSGADVAGQFKKMQDQMKEIQGHKKRDKATTRRSNNKLKSRGKKGRA